MNPSSYIYNRKNVEKAAEESKYKGIVQVKRGGNKEKLFVQWIPSHKKTVTGTKIKIKIDNND